MTREGRNVKLTLIQDLFVNQVEILPLPFTIRLGVEGVGYRRRRMIGFGSGGGREGERRPLSLGNSIKVHSLHLLLQL